jgi:hypothetical protein
MVVSRDFADRNPGTVRDFLAGWFESVAGRARTEAIAIAAKNYAALMSMFNPTGKFDPKALDVLARAFVEMGMLPKAPDMAA